MSCSPEQAPLRIGCAFSDRVEALLDGRVAIDGFGHDIKIVEPQRLFREVLNAGRWDVAELSMASHISAVGNGRRSYAGLPVFLSRSFRHSNIYIRTDRGIAHPSDLAGRRIGLIDYQQTAALWLRGILADEYGVSRSSVEWVAGGLHAPVLEDRAPSSTAPDIRLSRSEQSLDTLLREGEIDAVISPIAPRSFGEADVPVDRLWADAVAAERQWWARHRIFPIMHVVVVRRALIERYPRLNDALFEAFDDARRLAAADLDIREYPKIAAPWIASHVADARKVLGGDPWTYGVDANRSVLETMIRYAAEDGLVPDKFEPEALFE